MSIDTIRQFIKDEAVRFGAKADSPYNKSFIERNNTGKEALQDDGAYFGFISAEEESYGPFHDFSYTIFPSDQGKPWLVCLGIGSSGFKNDYELSTYPGLRRLFSKLINEDGFCKSDLSDIETSLPKSITGNPKLEHLKNTIKKYSKFLPVCQIVDDPETEKGKEIISAFLAGYAKIREWATNQLNRNAISTSLKPFLKSSSIDHLEEIKMLLNERKFIIIQGPPGTGKTRIAKKVSEKSKVFFIQFHAETTYSDFIYGIRPSINNTSLSYTKNDGKFTEAINYAIQNSNEQVVLIIDEINRANLSNVLGPIFYLFEYKMDKSDIELDITPDLKITELPKNFYVIATMNTADRSLAVVDFALRRRFAWYNLSPQIIETENFCKEDYNKIDEIFNWYANSNELALQPGQGYFIASSDLEMKNRIKYEIYPLIKEYLQEGLLRNAKEEFNNYFYNRINQSLFE